MQGGRVWPPPWHPDASKRLHLCGAEAIRQRASDLVRAATRHLEFGRGGPSTAASERGRAKRVFWRAVLGTKKILLRAKQTGRPDLRHAKRLVQPLVDSVMRHEYSIVGLTALKDHDEYTYAHCVNVSILSVSMGQVLGLSRQALYRDSPSARSSPAP